MTTTAQTLSAETGTDITRFNALRHGVLSRYTVLPWESADEYRSPCHATAPLPSPAKSTIRDRHTIFCGVLRSLTSLSSRSPSSGGTWMRSILPI